MVQNFGLFGLEKLVFPYEWLTSYNKLSHVGPVEYENFYSSLSGERNTLSPEEYEESCEQSFTSEGA